MRRSHSPNITTTAKATPSKSQLLYVTSARPVWIYWPSTSRILMMSPRRASVLSASPGCVRSKTKASSGRQLSRKTVVAMNAVPKMPTRAIRDRAGRAVLKLLRDTLLLLDGAHDTIGWDRAGDEGRGIAEQAIDLALTPLESATRRTLLHMLLQRRNILFREITVAPDGQQKFSVVAAHRSAPPHSAYAAA